MTDRSVAALAAVVVAAAALLSLAAPAPDLLAEYVASVRWLQGDNLVYDRLASESTWSRYAQVPAYPFVHAPAWVVLAAPWAMLPWDGARAVGVGAVFAGLVGSAGWAWARWSPGSLRPLPVALAFVILAFAAPVHETLALGNLHGLAIFGMVAAFFLADRHPALAGLALAAAVGLKITPAIVLLPWLLQGRWRALGSFALGILGLGLIGLALGPDASVAWWAVLVDNGARALTTPFAQGFSGLWARWAHPDAGPLDPLPTPWALRLVGPGLALAMAGWLWARQRRGGDLQTPEVLTACVGWTLLAPPLVWSHYHVALAIPAVALWARQDRIGTFGLLVLVIAQIPPVARTDLHTLALIPVLAAALWPRAGEPALARSGPGDARA